MSEDILLDEWFSEVKFAKIPHLQTVSSHSLASVGTVMLHPRMGEEKDWVVSEVVKQMAMTVLLGMFFIDNIL